eukprot:38447-Rhodomonas_salina.1
MESRSQRMRAQITRRSRADHAHQITHITHITRITRTSRTPHHAHHAHRITRITPTRLVSSEQLRAPQFARLGAARKLMHKATVVALHIVNGFPRRKATRLHVQRAKLTKVDKRCMTCESGRKSPVENGAVLGVESQVANDPACS